jgi:D-aminopeptidase
VRAEHVQAAIAAASAGPVEEGSVGAGTGTVCFGWKGGIGTASRKLPAAFGGHTLGVLVQTNFGGVLVVDGVPVGKELGRHAFSDVTARLATDPPPGGSCMIVVATDAPLSPRDLKRLAARGVFGLARTGSSYDNGSGDFAIAFSTTVRLRHGETEARPLTLLPTEGLSPLFEAVLEATEEAVLNSLFRATTVRGSGTTVEAIPVERVRELLVRYGRGRAAER